MFGPKMSRVMVILWCLINFISCRTTRGDDSAALANISSKPKEIEIDPELDEHLWDGEEGAAEDVAAIISESVRRRAQASDGVLRRDAHPKAHGCVKAKFTVEESLLPELAQGVFVPGQSYSAWIRFSNASSDFRRPDATGDGRGMAIKLVGVPGKKLLEDEADATTQDFLLINHPVFFNKDPREYVSLMRRLNSTNIFSNAATAISLGFDGAKIIAAIVQKKTAHPAYERYWSTTPFRLGEGPLKRAVKFSARPCQVVDNTKLPKDPDPDYLRLALVDSLAKGDLCYEFLVQPRTMPSLNVENSMIEWSEDDAPFYKVATITIPKQVFDTPKQREYCDSLSFTPWHSLPDHRPIGGTNRVRKVVYQTISKLRHEGGRPPRREPQDLSVPN